MTQSPCVRNCCLDKEDFCVGCSRHINEIVGWNKLSEQEKARIIRLCKSRKVNVNIK